MTPYIMSGDLQYTSVIYQCIRKPHKRGKTVFPLQVFIAIFRFYSFLLGYKAGYIMDG